MKIYLAFVYYLLYTYQFQNDVDTNHYFQSILIIYLCQLPSNQYRDNAEIYVDIQIYFHMQIQRNELQLTNDSLIIYFREQKMKTDIINNELMQFKQKATQSRQLLAQNSKLQCSPAKDGTQYSSPQKANASMRTIYLRPHNKTSIKIQVSPKVSISQIKAIAEQKLKIKTDKQILFLSGKNITEFTFILVQSPTIIHVLNKDHLSSKSDQISIHLNVVNYLVEKNKSVTMKYKLAASEIVGEFLTKVKKYVQSVYKMANNDYKYSLLQSSRILQLEKPFFEQCISKTTEITCTITANPAKTKFVNDYNIETRAKDSISQLNKQSDKIVNQLKIGEISKSLRQTDNQLSQTKSNSSLVRDNPIFSSSMPNFKKKINLTDDSFDSLQRPLIHKMKSLKPKEQINQILHIQSFQKYFFESPKRKDWKTDEQKMQIHKSSPLIPKLMPIKQRRTIRMQIEKLFNQSETETTPFQDGRNSKEQSKDIESKQKDKTDNKINKDMDDHHQPPSSANPLKNQFMNPPSL